MKRDWKPWSGTKNFGKRVTYLEQMAKSPLERAIEDLIAEISLYPGGKEEVAAIIETMQREIDARDSNN